MTPKVTSDTIAACTIATGPAQAISVSGKPVPSSTMPVLMYNSTRRPASTQRGTPTVLEISRPSASATSGGSRLYCDAWSHSPKA